MTPAELKAVREAYAAGYKAAHAEVPASQSGGAAQEAATAPPRRNFVDMKETYSDAGDVETVQEIPVSSAPLPDNTRPSQKAPAPHVTKVAQAPHAAAAPARAPSRDQLIAEFCSAAAPVHASGNPAPQPARPAAVTAREDQVPDDGENDSQEQAVTPQQFEADAQAYAREMTRSDDAQTDAQPAMQTASAEAPSPSGPAAPRRFWSAQYHTWITVGNSGQ